MPITNAQSGTRVDEVADGIYRISTPVPPTAIPGGFTFNQFLVLDELPLLFHTGPRRLFPLVREAMTSLMPVEKLRFVAFSHWEPDESGALNEWLQAAPESQAIQGAIGTNVCVNDQAIRPGRALADGESLSLGKRQVTWIDTPHLPTAGTAASSSSRPPARSSPATFSRKAASTSPPSPSTTSSVRARPSERR